MKKSSKRSSPVTVVIAILVVAGAVISAMYVADPDLEEWFDFERKEKVTQPLVLQGRWLGISLAGMTSPEARAQNFPPGTEGVVVVALNPPDGWRAQQAGLAVGDVITAVDGHNVADLADFYDHTRDLDVAKAIPLEVQRQGQPVTLVLPAVVAVAAPGQPAVPGQPVPGGQPVPLQPAVPGQLLQPGQPGIGVGLPPGGGQQVQGALWACPVHQQGWSQQAVHPHYRCPVCSRQLVQQVR